MGSSDPFDHDKEVVQRSLFSLPRSLRTPHQTPPNKGNAGTTGLIEGVQVPSNTLTVPDDAWRRMGLRRLRQSDKVPAADCVAHSFGEVREFLVRTPCRSLDRIVFAVGDDQGNATVVSVAWVEFPNRSAVRKFQRLEDRHGTGDVKPLGSSLLGMHDIEFTGHHYNAEPRGTTLTIAEAETISGTYSADDLDAITEVAALLPRP
ncbi:hypothetical protein [Saccharopolyspora shandongensis]|uniref:hypothetical protein n=1 Tax=Saccharopolyspora shandongensis TaxID=418495 RepID=UPI0033F219F1